jgi:hypothetical protein
MSTSKLLLTTTIATAFLIAGCIGDIGDLDDDLDRPVGNLLARAQPLWHAPQDFPHPAFGWPTLTNPPEGADIPDWWQPITEHALPESISGMAHLAGTLDNEEEHRLPAGGGFAAFGSLVVMPTYEAETFIMDISDITQPRVLSTIEPQTRGAIIIPYPDGTLITVLATSNDLLVYDITDPENPEDLGGLGPSQGSHKVGVVPGTPIVYNAASVGGTQGDNTNRPAALLGDGIGVTEIFDLSDPLEPVHVMDFDNGYSCHHIYFHINPETDKYRTICAGIEYTQIWDIADPKDPIIISEISMPLGGDLPGLAVSPAMLSHFAILSNDGTTLIVGDETGGGAAPACDAYLHVGGTTISGPVGNLWFYDVTDESDPVLQGWMSPTHHYPTNPPSQDQGPEFVEGVPFPAGCTAHHGRLVPDPEGRDLLAMGYYGAGVILVDFTDATAPYIVDQWNPNTNTWEVWYYNGHLITGDLSRGMDILVFE